MNGRGRKNTAMVEHLPLVSVVMIFLNAERYIDQAIKSVFAQTYEHWELVLVDDGSTDGSTAIARGYAARFPARVRYLEHLDHQNHGMSASRNAGIANARGTLLALLDADDVYLPQKLERQVALMQAHPSAAMVYGPTLHWYSWSGRPEDQQRDRLRTLGVTPDRLIAPPTLATCFLRGTAQTPGTCGVLVRRNAVERVGVFEEQFRGMFDDQVFFYKICLALPVFVMSECLDWYRQHPQSFAEQARQQGHNHKQRTTPLYAAFLVWLESHLAEAGIKDRQLWAALRREFMPYRHPALYQLSFRVQARRLRHASNAIKGLLYRRLVLPLRGQ